MTALDSFQKQIMSLSEVGTTDINSMYVLLVCVGTTLACIKTNYEPGVMNSVVTEVTG